MINWRVFGPVSPLGQLQYPGMSLSTGRRSDRDMNIEEYTWPRQLRCRSRRRCAEGRFQALSRSCAHTNSLGGRRYTCADRNAAQPAVARRMVATGKSGTYSWNELSGRGIGIGIRTKFRMASEPGGKGRDICGRPAEPPTDHRLLVGFVHVNPWRRRDGQVAEIERWEPEGGREKSNPVILRLDGAQ